jgi:hypothetical protein
MKTKTIFKTLALAMMMPAMMLTTACSSSDDDTIVNNENTAKKGFTLPVTVNVTRQGDATRALYNETSKKLEFSEGDKLFVSGYIWGTVGSFAGTLNYVSEGTFSGTITTENEYSGTAEELLSQSDNFAVLLPNGYEDYGFFSIENDGYDAELNYDYTQAFTTSTDEKPAKVLAVEQFSYEWVEGYSIGTGFALSPKSAILNFTITHLTPNTQVTATLTNNAESYFIIIENVETDGGGTATFAIGVKDYCNLEDFSLTVDNIAITLITPYNHDLTFEAGHIYNITRRGRAPE